MGDRADHNLAYGPLLDSTGFLLRLAQLDAYAALFGRIGEQASPAQMAVLIMIARNPGIRQGALARALRIKRAQMTKMIRALEGAGLVTGHIPADDRRTVRLTLTVAGAERAEALWSQVAADEAAPAARLSASETQSLRRLLRKHLGLVPCNKGQDA